MPRKANYLKLQKASSLLHRRPGKKPGTYARKLHMHKEAFNRLLVQLNDLGILFYEDEQGRIWPFK